MKIYIMLPVYNEEGSAPVLLQRVKSMVENRHFEYEIIAYNDGSTDNTLAVLQEHARTQPLRIIGKDKNEGLGYAVNALLQEAVSVSEGQDDVVVVHDSDNTHNPEHIYNMVNRIRDGFDVVIASRYRPDSQVVGVSPLRQLLSLGASWMMRLIFPIRGVRDYTCGYRAYSVPLLQRAFDYYGDRLIEEQGFACMAELLIKLRRLRLLAVEVPILLRYDEKVGASKMKILRTVRRTLAMLLRLRFRGARPRDGGSLVGQ